MYPDLSYFFHDWIGTPYDNWLSIFKTFGLFLALAIIVAAYILRLELKRKQEEGIFESYKEKVLVGNPATWYNLLGSFLFGFAFGYKLGYVFIHFAAFKANPAAVLISLKGNWYWGIALGLFWAFLNYVDRKRQVLPEPKEEIREIYPHQRIGDITIIAALAGIAGAKLFDLIEHLPEFFQNPYEVLFSGGGLAIYGGLIVGFLAVIAYLRAYKIPLRPVMDAVAPALIVAYGIGRMGCHFSGDGDWGIENANPLPDWWFLPDWIWAFDYPRNVLNWGNPIEGCDGFYCKALDVAVYPTPIYEIFLAFVIGGILWAMRKRLPIHGMLFCVYLILNGIERFFIERIRINERYENLFNLTQAEIISFSFILIGIAGLIYLWVKNPDQPKANLEPAIDQEHTNS